MGSADGFFVYSSTENSDKITNGSLESFVAVSGKWGDSGAYGTNGGVVTWSLAGAGLTNQSSDSSFFSGTTVSMTSFLGFDFLDVLGSAFDAWSTVADIAFIQVQDGGGNMGQGTFANIRLGGAFQDGPSNTLAAAYLPSGSGTNNQSAQNGDVIFDSGDTTFWNAQSFFLVALHEIGHSLGLSHENTNLAIMNPFYNPSLSSLQADDINGIRNIYGTQDNDPKIYTMPSTQTNLTLLDGAASLTIFANNLGNIISGSGIGETIVGSGGADTIYGQGGNDIIYGDSNNNSGGISLGSGQVVKNAGAGNDSIGTAMDISSQFSLAADADIGNATVTPHVSVVGTGDDSVDYYSVTINNPGSSIILDIDHGNRIGLNADDMDTWIQLFDADGNTLILNDDSTTSSGASGSTSSQDSYLSYTFASGGTYYIAVGSYSNLSAIATGDTYELQVSVSGELANAGWADSLDGGAGNDVLLGGSGADILRGGAHMDSAVYWNASGGVTASLTDPSLNTGDAAGDTYDSIENLQGSFFSDFLYGDEFANRILGWGGNDVLQGGAGADLLNGGAHMDSAVYWNASGGVTASLTDPSLNTGDAAGDTYDSIENLQGSWFSDTLTGDEFANRILGWGGNDVLLGGPGPDFLDGGAHMDSAVYWTASGGVAASLDNPSLNTGDAAGDTYDSIENLQGSWFDDTLTGDEFANRILGWGGNDVLNGGGGNDRLNGGLGDDLLTGGNGNDTFVTMVGGGADVIFDFEGGPGVGDVVDVTAFGVLDAGNIFASITDMGGNAVLDLGGGTVTFQGVLEASLNVDDFLFI